MQADNKQLLRQYLDAWARRDLDALVGMLDAGCVTHNLATGKTLPGVDFEPKACEVWHAAFADTTLTVKKLVAEDSEVVAYWQLSGTHAGAFMNLEPTGKAVSVPGMEIVRVQRGKIAEIWRLSDTMSLMQQLGAM